VERGDRLFLLGFAILDFGLAILDFGFAILDFDSFQRLSVSSCNQM
jgi:hypothetical protein